MKTRLIVLTLCALAILATGCDPSGSGPTSTPAPPTPTPYGEQITIAGVTASSESAWAATYAIDGIHRTRWQPTGQDIEWIAVDLGATHFITRVTYHFHPGAELAGSHGGNNHPVAYEVQVSDDAENWTTVRTITDGEQETPVDDFTGFDTSARYVRLYLIEVSELSGGPDNYDVFEIEVYGEQSD